MESQEPVDNEEFERLIEIMKQRTDLTDKESKDDRLKLYSSGRQGKFGDNKDPKPGMFDIVGKLKWSAWKEREGQDQEECKREFIQRAKAILAKDKKWTQGGHLIKMHILLLMNTNTCFP